jgi:hypothetical protein
MRHHTVERASIWELARPPRDHVLGQQDERPLGLGDKVMNPGKLFDSRKLKIEGGSLCCHFI